MRTATELGLRMMMPPDRMIALPSDGRRGQRLCSDRKQVSGGLEMAGRAEGRREGSRITRAWRALGVFAGATQTSDRVKRGLQTCGHDEAVSRTLNDDADEMAEEGHLKSLFSVKQRQRQPERSDDALRPRGRAGRLAVGTAHLGGGGGGRRARIWAGTVSSGHPHPPQPHLPTPSPWQPWQPREGAEQSWVPPPEAHPQTRGWRCPALLPAERLHETRPGAHPRKEAPFLRGN